MDGATTVLMGEEVFLSLDVDALVSLLTSGICVTVLAEGGSQLRSAT